MEKAVLEIVSTGRGGAAVPWLTAACCAGARAAALVVKIAVWRGHSDSRSTSRPQLATQAQRALFDGPLKLLPARARSPSRPLAAIAKADRRPLLKVSKLTSCRRPSQMAGRWAWRARRSAIGTLDERSTVCWTSQCSRNHWGLVTWVHSGAGPGRGLS